jgi:adenylate cyclase, class 2
METEYEAKFLNVDKDEVRTRLRRAGAVLARPEFLQRRKVLDLPTSTREKGLWLRVRDEGDKITMSWKSQQGTAIHDQKEISVTVDDFDNAVALLEKIGCPVESYQETRRELWLLGDIEITIDSWPFVETFVEVEGKSEQAVRDASIQLGFDWSKALFEGVIWIYRQKFGQHVNIRRMPRLTFDMPNPFA